MVSGIKCINSRFLQKIIYYKEYVKYQVLIISNMRVFDVVSYP